MDCCVGATDLHGPVFSKQNVPQLPVGVWRSRSPHPIKVLVLFLALLAHLQYVPLETSIGCRTTFIFAPTDLPLPTANYFVRASTLMTSVRAIATLVVYVISVVFVIRPVYIPTLHPIPRIPLNFTTAPVLAIALLWATQCIDLSVIRNGVVGTEGLKPYSILILFFSLAYLAITLDITGLLRAATFWVSNNMDGDHRRKLYFYFYIMITLVCILLDNNPVILFGTGFLVYYTEGLQLDLRACIMAEFAAANTASTVLLVWNLTNVRILYIKRFRTKRVQVVICESFNVNIAAFTTYTIPPFFVYNIYCFIVLAFQYMNQVLRKSTRDDRQDPRSALLDPFGACVGSIMLGATLILCLVVSFFGIDVWMISLPFAVTKFLFDLGWDHYRRVRGIQILGRGKQNTREGIEKGPVVNNNQGTQDEPLHHSSHTDVEGSSFPADKEAAVESHPETPKMAPKTEPEPQSLPVFDERTKIPSIFKWYQPYVDRLHHRLDHYFPTFVTALPRLPFALVLFAFSQFILIEALNQQGWVEVFAHWLNRASHNQVASNMRAVSFTFRLPSPACSVERFGPKGDHREAEGVCFLESFNASGAEMAVLFQS